MLRSLCCVSLTECTCCVCLCCAVARSLVQQCVAVLFARGVTEQSRHLSLSGSALPFPKGVTLIDPAARTVTVPHPGSHEHEVPSLSLSLESFVCRSHRGRVSSVRARPCAKESLSVGCLVVPALVRASPRQLPVDRRWFLNKSLCATVERWECRPLVHERDFQFSVCSQHCRLHTLSYPMSTSGVFQPL